MVVAYALIEINGSTPSGVGDFIIADSFTVVNLITLERLVVDLDWINKNNSFICTPNLELNKHRNESIISYFTKRKGSSYTLRDISFNSKKVNILGEGNFSLLYNGLNLRSNKLLSNDYFVLYEVWYVNLAIDIVYFPYTDEFKLCYSEFKFDSLINLYYNAFTGNFIGHSENTNIYRLDLVRKFTGYEVSNNLAKIGTIYFITKRFTGDTLVLPEDCKAFYIGYSISVDNLVLLKGFHVIEVMYSLLDICFRTVYLSSELKEKDNLPKLIDMIRDINKSIQIGWY